MQRRPVLGLLHHPLQYCRRYLAEGILLAMRAALGKFDPYLLPSRS